MTGGVITSAGLVLAATFGALAVLPLLFLFQIAFIVSSGVLIDTFVVRSLVVPAIGGARRAAEPGGRAGWREEADLGADDALEVATTGRERTPDGPVD